MGCLCMGRSARGLLLLDLVGTVVRACNDYTETYKTHLARELSKPGQGLRTNGFRMQAQTVVGKTRQTSDCVPQTTPPDAVAKFPFSARVQLLLCAWRMVDGSFAEELQDLAPSTRAPAGAGASLQALPTLVPADGMV